jgi:hypothetical protein
MARWHQPSGPGRGARAGTTILGMKRSALALATALALASAQAQPLDAPPPLPARGGDRATARPEPARTAAELRDTIIEDEALTELQPARRVSPVAKIVQRRQGNRVVELTVTPAGSTRSYTIVNRDGQRPLSVQDLGSGLSTPRFFKLDF